MHVYYVAGVMVHIISIHTFATVFFTYYFQFFYDRYVGDNLCYVSIWRFNKKVRSKQRNPTYQFEIIKKSYVKEAESPRISLCTLSVIHYSMY